MEEICGLTKIDPWFLHQLKDLVEFSEELANYGKLLRQGRGQEQFPLMLRQAKEWGFSDRQLANLQLVLHHFFSYLFSVKDHFK